MYWAFVAKKNCGLFGDFINEIKGNIWIAWKLQKKEDYLNILKVLHTFKEVNLDFGWLKERVIKELFELIKVAEKIIIWFK